MLEFRNLTPFCSFFPIEIAKVKSREILYCVTKIAKEITREIMFQGTRPKCTTNHFHEDGLMSRKQPNLPQKTESYWKRHLATKLFYLLCSYHKIVHPPEHTAVEFYKYDHHNNLTMPTPQAPSSNLLPQLCNCALIP